MVRVVIRSQSVKVTADKELLPTASAYCLLSSTYRLLLFRAICTEAFATQHRAAAGRLEGNGVGLATLIASNLKPLTFSAGPP